MELFDFLFRVVFKLIIYGMRLGMMFIKVRKLLVFWIFGIIFVVLFLFFIMLKFLLNLIILVILDFYGY